jgi:hypothetical protein
MEFEIIGGFVGINTPRDNEKIPSYDITTVDPESMFNGKDEPSRYHTERLLPKNPPWLRSSNQRLAVRPESLPTAINVSK